MTYQVTLADDVVSETIRFRGDQLLAWNLCLQELATYPWQRVGAGFEIEEQTDARDDESATMVFTAAWFEPAIVYFAKQHALDDGPPGESEGVVYIWQLVWP